MTKPLFKAGDDWTQDLLEEAWKEIAIIAKEDLNQTYYEPQIEVITAAQMLDAYTSVGMPIMYRHWSFGKELVQSVSPEESAQLEFKFMCDDVPRQACKAKDCV